MNRNMRKMYTEEEIAKLGNSNIVIYLGSIEDGDEISIDSLDDGKKIISFYESVISKELITQIVLLNFYDGNSQLTSCVPQTIMDEDWGSSSFTWRFVYGGNECYLIVDIENKTITVSIV